MKYRTKVRLGYAAIIVPWLGMLILACCLTFPKMTATEIVVACLMILTGASFIAGLYLLSQPPDDL